MTINASLFIAEICIIYNLLHSTYAIIVGLLYIDNKLEVLD